MFPKKSEPILFGLLVSGLMSFVVSGVSTYLSVDGIDTSLWFANWIKSWIVAFPTILLVAPMVRRMVKKLVSD